MGHGRRGVFLLAQTLYRDEPALRAQIEFRPLRAHDLAAPLSHNQQESEGEPRLTGDPPITEVEPQAPDLLIGQHALPGSGLARDRFALYRCGGVRAQVASPDAERGEL